MDREQLFRHLEQRYTSKRDLIARVPLGIRADEIWQELLRRRKATSTVLPINDRNGIPYWYVTTEKMITASEKIVDTLLDNDDGFDPYTDALSISTLEEIFYTSYVDGSGMSIQDAMSFLQSDSPPRDVEELLIVNNRQASNYASENLLRPIDDIYLRELAYILTDGIESGGHEYRTTDEVDFTSPDNGSFTFPTASSIPERVDELVGFLSDRGIHPLIKAAVSQAWTMIVRPFPEGNERLGRILSNIILLRAGYHFFRDVSLSALIARKGYGYYDAIENCMREENGGDLTYFLEYFLDLLSRAIDERRLRMSKKEAQDLAEENELAKTPLGSGRYRTRDDKEQQSGPSSPPVDDRPFDSSDYVSPDETVGEPSPKAKLQDYAKDTGRVIGMVANIILRMHEEGIDHTTATELGEELGLIPNQLSSSLRYLCKNGILRAERRKGKNVYIIFPDGEDYPKTRPDAEIMEQIQMLVQSNSMKDRRIARTILDHMDRGELTIADYEEQGMATRWAGDMQLAEQMGLVEKGGSGVYKILYEHKGKMPSLSRSQKRIITDLYDTFGEEMFSIEMVVATLDYSGSHASAVLHQFTLLRLVDCQTGDVNLYQFLINPTDHPECFEQAA